TIARVNLRPEITAKLGQDYIVIVTNRYPTGGFPYFGVYWKPSKEGFDLSLVDTSISWGTTSSYSNRNKTYLIDWIVVYDPTMAARNKEADPAAAKDGDILLSVRVPGDAMVWINGEQTTQTGTRREFASSGHTLGKTYVYTVRAQW